MTEHTPRPWHLDGVAICDKDGKHIARVYMPKGMTIEEFAANAKLIAAAPEMYKLLNNILHAGFGMEINLDELVG